MPNICCKSYPIKYILLKGHLLETPVSLSSTHQSLKIQFHPKVTASSQEEKQHTHTQKKTALEQLQSDLLPTLRQQTHKENNYRIQKIHPQPIGGRFFFPSVFVCYIIHSKQAD